MQTLKIKQQLGCSVAGHKNHNRINQDIKNDSQDISFDSLTPSVGDEMSEFYQVDRVLSCGSSR